MDCTDVVIHIFHEPVRDLYRLETNWTDARQAALPEPFSSLARRLDVSARARRAPQPRGSASWEFAAGARTWGSKALAPQPVG
jgi:hypothetical protein